ncbi:cache domain-containing protein [Rhodoferax aquaticus]|uniref:Histidine kinase n=1 Tax=Rhodoferax aquaticus TaxID=2527691 RepID=A0A515EQX8_9BURK|nr:cache domain-containing protein [Rhodoferax aquaticus]QDL55068.1 histidine kinase [Rhodoferax aquaticus]
MNKARYCPVNKRMHMSRVMRQSCRALLSIALGLCVGGAAAQNAPVRSSAAQAQALMKKAQAYVKQHGMGDAFTEFNQLDSPFNVRSDINPNGDLYLYSLDYQGFQAVHGKNPKIRGKVMIDMLDSEGVPLIRKMAEKCKNPGRGWVDYRWPHPLTKEIEPKSGYVERIPGTQICLGTGIYK